MIIEFLHSKLFQRSVWGRVWASMRSISASLRWFAYMAPAPKTTQRGTPIAPPIAAMPALWPPKNTRPAIDPVRPRRVFVERLSQRRRLHSRKINLSVGQMTLTFNVSAIVAFSFCKLLCLLSRTIRILSMNATSSRHSMSGTSLAIAIAAIRCRASAGIVVRPVSMPQLISSENDSCNLWLYLPCYAATPSAARSAFSFSAPVKCTACQPAARAPSTLA